MNTATYTADPLNTASAACPTKTGAGRHTHSICWSAVFAGAAGAASLSLILLILGVGLGLSTVSPWASEGVSAEGFGWSTVGWLTFTQLAASGLGGYLAGRLRVRWNGVHADEAHFRDTAHGFLAWSIATLATAGLLASAVGTVVSSGVKTAGGAAAAVTAVAAPAAATAANGAMGGTMSGGSGSGYFADSLFRKDASAAAAAASAVPANTMGGMPAVADDGNNGAPRTAEAGRILASALSSGALPPEDARYLGQLVAQRTGLSQADAEKRVTDTFSRMKAKADAAKQDAQAAADKARKASATASMWIFISLLIGAFVASYMALSGGRHRDQF